MTCSRIQFKYQSGRSYSEKRYFGGGGCFDSPLDSFSAEHILQGYFDDGIMEKGLRIKVHSRVRI